MRRNLISGANIDLAGNKIIWSNSKMIVYDKNRNYSFTIPRVGKLYILYGYSQLNSVMYTSSTNLDLVNMRFCHINIQILKYTSSKNCIKGIEKLTNIKDSENCSVCKISKSTRISFKKNYIYKRNTKRALERVYMDLWGPAPVNSLGGNKYFLSII